MQPGIPIRFVLAAGLVLAAAGAIDATMNNYTVRETNEDGVKLYVLRDGAKDVEVKVAPQFGNIATSMTAHGKAVLWTPYPSAGEWAQHPAMGGVPFLWPWANRIDGWSYWVNGRKYALNPDLGNLRASPKDAPIHGLLLFAKQWKVTRAGATEDAAELESSFEFWREPALMEQFPFANTVTMIYRLREGVLEVETRVENLSSEPMPVALGFHPVFSGERRAARRMESAAAGAREIHAERAADPDRREAAQPVRQSADAEGHGAGRRAGRAGARRGRMGALPAGRRQRERHGGVRRGLSGGSGLCAAGAELRLLRADERADQRFQRGPRRLVQGAAGGGAGRRVEGRIPRSAGRILRLSSRRAA